MGIRGRIKRLHGPGQRALRLLSLSETLPSRAKDLLRVTPGKMAGRAYPTAVNRPFVANDPSSGEITGGADGFQWMTGSWFARTWQERSGDATRIAVGWYRERVLGKMMRDRHERQCFLYSGGLLCGGSRATTRSFSRGSQRRRLPDTVF
jgi:hypothetical protein